MAALKAPVLGGKSAKDVSLDEAVFGAELKPHLVHEAVRAEANSHRQGTGAAKSRGLVSGVGGNATPRSFDLKVNKKAMKAALRSALSDHAQAGTLGLVDASTFDAPSTKGAVALLETWGKRTPTVVVVADGEESLAKSFRNLQRVIVTLPSELEVAHVVWARSLLVSQAALDAVQQRAAR
jgi:large subunit ribosomal protein L4